MTNPRDEELLRERFHELRADVRRSAGTPDFRTMMARAKEDATATPALEVTRGGAPAGQRAVLRRVFVVGGWASAAVAAAVAGILLLSGSGDRDAEFERLVASFATDRSAGAWQSPTSRLLDVPGIELTRSMPWVGTSTLDLDPALRPEPPDPDRRENRL